MVHYTDSQADLLSMLRYGFLFTEHSNGVLDVVARGRVLEGQGTSMVCFCEPGGNNANRFLKHFGKFGVAIDKRAFAGREVHQVRYLDPQGSDVQRLAHIFDRFAPEHRPILDPAGDDMANRLQSMLISSARELRGYPVRRSWLRFIHELRFCETAAHSWEREWRLEGPSSLMPLEGASPKQQRELLAGVLQGMVNRCETSGRFDPSDRLLAASLAFFVPVHLIRWLEVHPAKVTSISHKLRDMQRATGVPFGRIEVRSIGR
ncbi:hypothetical protein [Ideonella sp.]|uniref:hypothetical protein n=1 Tax=Ideonella sp. TaxID=1929293 RepID=UPI0035B30CCB